MAYTSSASAAAATMASPGAVQEGNPRLRSLFALFEKHPMISALLIWIADLLVSNLATLGAAAWLPDFQPDFIALCIVTGVTALALLALGWWREIGFNRPSEWRHLRVLILPGIAMVVFPLVGGLNMLDAGTTLYFVVAYALVAFHEEAVFRGLMLRVLRPTGVGRAVVIGSLLFGAAHLTNLFVRANPAIVFAQAFGAFTEGIGFAMIRFRTNTLWGLIALHFVEDLLLHYGNLPVPLVNAAQSIVCLGVGIYLYWQHRRERAVKARG